jgi:hypothetical protein
MIMLIASMGLIGTALAEEKYPSEVTLFKNVNIFDGVSDQLKLGYDVLVVRNKIHKIAKGIPTAGSYEVEVTSGGEKQVQVLSGYAWNTYTITVKEGDAETKTQVVKVNVIDGGPANERHQYRGYRKQQDLGRPGYQSNGKCRKLPDVRVHLVA